MKLPVNELYDLTFRQFSNAQRGFFELEDARNKQEWDRTRVLAAWMHNTSGFAKQGKTPEELMPMPWDKQPEPEIEMTPEELFEKLANGKPKRLNA